MVQTFAESILSTVNVEMKGEEEVGAQGGECAPQDAGRQGEG